MTGRTDTERILDLFLAPEPERLADRVVDAALSDIAVTPQRTALRLPWRFPGFVGTSRAATFAAVALVAVIGAVGVGALLGRVVSTGGYPTPSPSASEAPTPSPVPTRAVRLNLIDGDGPLAPGTYVFPLFPTDLGFDIPDGERPGWRVDDPIATYASLSWAEPGAFGYAISFFIVEAIHSDPCNEFGGVEAVPGRSVDALIATLERQGAFRVSAPVEIVVGAFQGKEIVLTGREGEGTCDEMWAWAGAHKISLAPGEERVLRVIDADGVAVVIETWFPDEPIPAAAAGMDQILDSLRMEFIAPRASS